MARASVRPIGGAIWSFALVGAREPLGSYSGDRPSPTRMGARGQNTGRDSRSKQASSLSRCFGNPRNRSSAGHMARLMRGIGNEMQAGSAEGRSFAVVNSKQGARRAQWINARVRAANAQEAGVATWFD